jgi:hypothetical protein
MKVLTNNIKIQQTESGLELVLSVQGTLNEHKQEVLKLKELISKDKKLIAEIKQHRSKRSHEANRYMWALCQKIAESLHTTKEEIYREAIRKVGQFDMIQIDKKAAESFIQRWNKTGLGWYAETAGNAPMMGNIMVLTYYGSSTYNTKEMSVLIDYIVDECKRLDIETIPEHELERIKQAWKK